MPQGIETYDAAGKVLFSSDVLTWALRRTGSGTSGAPDAGNTLASTITIPIDIRTYSRPMIGFQCSAYVGFLGPNPTNGNPRYACSANGVAYNWFLFDWAADIPNLGYGFETFTSSGQRAYSSAQRALQPLAILGSPVTFTGKSLAVVIPSWGGHETWPPDGTCYDNTPAEAWERGMSCSNLVIAQDSKIYGARTTNSNQSADAGQISYSDINISTSSAGWNAHNDFEVSVPIFVADVTGVPIGSTFF